MEKIISDLWLSDKGDLGFKVVNTDRNKVRFLKHIGLPLDNMPLNTIVDTSSFEYLGGGFYMDKSNIYAHFIMADGGVLTILEADYDTFEVMGDEYAKDKKQIYVTGGRIVDADYDTFQTCKGCSVYGKDKNGYIFWDEKIHLTQANIAEMEKLDEELSKVARAIRELNRE